MWIVGDTWPVLPWVRATFTPSCPQVSPDCPSFPTQWYSITMRRGDGASKKMKQVKAKDFPLLNDSVVTITVNFDTLLPQGMLDVEVFKVNAQNWNSSSKSTGPYVKWCIHVQVAAEKKLCVKFSH